MTLVKFYPGNKELSKAKNEFLSYSDLWNDFFHQDFSRSSHNSPSVNVREEADMFEIEMALPGIDKKELKINIEKNVISISKDQAEGNEDSNYSMREFNFSSFERSFRLPNTIDNEKIEAKMHNGILSIKLPKKKEAIDHGPRDLKIS